MKRRKKVDSISITKMTADECPAKTWHSNGSTLLGRSVYEHCAIVGFVAQTLINQFPKSLQTLFPNGSALLAACHDVGKLSLSFCVRLLLVSNKRIDEAQKLCGEAGVDCDYQKITNLEKLWGKHEGVSFLTLQKLTNNDEVAWIVGSHHGECPSVSVSIKDKALGGLTWQEEREKLVHRLETLFNIPLPTSVSPCSARLIAGLTTVADWIGSGEMFDNPKENWKSLIRPSLEKAGFIKMRVHDNLSFGDIFQSNKGIPYVPSEIQSTLGKMPSKFGIYILEAPMGAGKTEASFFAAYQALRAGLARGIYFALPTQITANKIYERFAIFLSRIDESGFVPKLLHSNAEQFLDRIQIPSVETSPGGSWFSYRKRGLLAPYAVGTLDQILLAIMAVRHNAVRIFGLAGKVIIIDEVHTYDAYTNYLLLQLLKYLKELRCIVIVLSATLTKRARSRLLGSMTDVETLGPAQLSYQAGNSPIRTIPFEIAETKKVLLNLQVGSEAENQAIDEVISRAESGEQVLWIENDVTSCQKIYKILAARTSCGIECGALHSRFTKSNRAKIEGHWLNLFGKEGSSKRGIKGRILIGTQILEQSLDIDADFLVSRLAVTDMLLQRIGRLWRHKETVRPPSAKPEVLILSPEMDEVKKNPRKAFGTSAWVYSPYYLCRSLEVFSCRNSLILPTDIPTLLEETYKERNEEINSFAKMKEELISGNPALRIKSPSDLERLAHAQLSTTIRDYQEDEDVDEISTRYMAIPSAEVLLLKTISLSDEIINFTLLDGNEISLPWKRKDSAINLRSIAQKVDLNLVKVHKNQALKFRTDTHPNLSSNNSVLEIGFSRVLWTGRDKKNLYIAIVKEGGFLETVEGERTPYRYTAKIGWEKIDD